MSKGEWRRRFSEVATIVVFATILGSVFGIAYVWLNIEAWLNIGNIGSSIILGGILGVLTSMYLRWNRRRRKDRTGS